MKKDTHPEYKKIKVTCSCGHEFEVGMTRKDDLTIEVCDRCHSFYTGQQKVFTKGRVEQYKARYEMPRPVAQQTPKTTETKKPTKAAPKVKKAVKKPETTVQKSKTDAKEKTTETTKDKTKSK